MNINLRLRWISFQKNSDLSRYQDLMIASESKRCNRGSIVETGKRNRIIIISRKRSEKILSRVGVERAVDISARRTDDESVASGTVVIKRAFSKSLLPSMCPADLELRVHVRFVTDHL